MTKGRPAKTTVDYFPHAVAHKKTIYTLESLYGNNGYAFWFKLLELLGSSDGHFYDFGKQPEWLYLVARSGVSEEEAKSILETLVKLGAIDEKLYHVQIVWCERFCTNLRHVYDKRSTEMPVKPTLRGEKRLSVPKKQQSKVKQSKVKKDMCKRFEKFWSEYPRKINKKGAYKIWERDGLGNGPFEDIMSGLSSQKKSDQWEKEDGQFIPHPTTWLNNERWTDEVNPEDPTPTFKWEGTE